MEPLFVLFCRPCKYIPGNWKTVARVLGIPSEYGTDGADQLSPNAKTCLVSLTDWVKSPSDSSFFHTFKVWFPSDTQHLCVSFSTSPLLSSWLLNRIILQGKPLINDRHPPIHTHHHHQRQHNPVFCFICHHVDPVRCMICRSDVFIPSWLETGSAAVIIWYPLHKCFLYFSGGCRKRQI